MADPASPRTSPGAERGGSWGDEGRRCFPDAERGGSRGPGLEARRCRGGETMGVPGDVNLDLRAGSPGLGEASPGREAGPRVLRVPLACGVRGLAAVAKRGVVARGGVMASAGRVGRGGVGGAGGERRQG